MMSARTYITNEFRDIPIPPFYPVPLHPAVVLLL